MTLDEIRQKYPQYSDMSDQVLADALYQRHYSDMDRREFDRKIGLSTFQPLSERTEGPLTPAIRGAEYVAGLGQQVMDTLMLGGADEVAAGLETGFGLWGDYEGKRQRLVEQGRQFQEDNPLASSTAQAAGAVAPFLLTRYLPAAALPQVEGNLGGRMLGYGAGGGLAGGAAAALTAEGDLADRSEAGKWGLAAGTTFGASLPLIGDIVTKVGKPGVNAILRWFSGEKSDALPPSARRILQQMAEDQITPEQGLRMLGDLGPQASIADLSHGLAQLARQVGLRPGRPASMASQFFNARRGGHGARVEQSMLDQMTGGDPRFYGTFDELNQTRINEASPLYDDAYSQPPLLLETPVVGTDITLDQLFKRPSMQAAFARALRIAREEGRDPNSLGFVFNEAGDPVGIDTPSWRTLDYVRRGIDDVLESRRDPTTLRLRLDEEGRAILETRQAFNKTLRANNDAYASALDAWSGPTRAIEMMNNGRLFMRGDPEGMIGRYEDMSPVEQEYYRIGAAQELKTVVERTTDGRDLFNKLWGNEAMRRRLTALFPDQDALARFVQAVESEHTMMRTANLADPDVGPSTAPRLVGGGMLRANAVGQALAQLVRGNVSNAALESGRALAPAAIARLEQRRAEELSPLLFTNDRNVIESVLAPAQQSIRIPRGLLEQRLGAGGLLAGSESVGRGVGGLLSP